MYTTGDKAGKGHYKCVKCGEVSVVRALICFVCQDL